MLYFIIWVLFDRSGEIHEWIFSNKYVTNYNRPANRKSRYEKSPKSQVFFSKSSFRNNIVHKHPYTFDQRTCCTANVYKHIPLYRFNFDKACTIIWHTTRKLLLKIRKVIDKRTKIKSKCSRGGGLNLCPPRTSVFPEIKILKILLP